MNAGTDRRDDITQFESNNKNYPVFAISVLKYTRKKIKLPYLKRSPQLFYGLGPARLL
jgi:hypothetical protein